MDQQYKGSSYDPQNPYGQGYGQQYPPPTNQPYFVDQPGYATSGNNTQNVTPIKPQEEPTTGWRDLPFAILFLINVAGMVGLMVLWGFDALKKSNTSSSTSSSTSDISSEDTKKLIGIAVGMSVLAIVLSMALVKLIVKYAKCMITFVLWFNVGISFAVAAFGFATGNFVLGIIGSLIALLNLCYARWVVHRIPFAVANLNVAGAAVSKHPSTYCVSISMTIVQVGWVIIWSLALVGVADHLRSEKTSTGAQNGAFCVAATDCISNYCVRNKCQARSFQQESTTNYVIYFFMLISFYWGLQVFKNIAHTTIAGTVATFWFQADSKGATGSSLKRSCTTSLGSICFGSLLVAILQALRTLAEQAREQGSCAACIAECILSILQSLMEYFNRWAYVYVGIYGYKFTKAGKAVFDLFAQRGFDAIINDDLIGNVLFFAALGVGIICAGIGVLLTEVVEVVKFNNAAIFLGVLGFVLGIGVAITPLSVVDSSIATIFVCFAEDPAAFRQSHPDLYEPLVREWHNLYPEVMVQAGYYYA